MTREEAEARLAEAKAQLAAAEQAYREVVPCEHPTIQVIHPDQFSCADCGVPLADPRGCQHRRIDNDTESCAACGELMERSRREAVTVLDAPNAAACTNPECSGDVEDPNCSNPHGLYVPDRSQEREVPILWDITYQCRRCQFDSGDVTFVDGTVVWDCGHDHRGDSIPIKEEAAL